MSTRIFVRGLPPKFTDNDFKSHFSKQGAVTDARLIPSRRIGYVGYKTPEEAAAAVKYFNKSFIRMSRIGVELARTREDDSLPRAWSAHTPGSSAYKKRHDPLATQDKASPAPQDQPLKRKRPGAEGDSRTGPVETDPKLKEFLEVMQPRSKTRTWGNGDLSSFSQDTKVEAPQQPLTGGDGDDEYESIPIQKKRQKSLHTNLAEIGFPEPDAAEGGGSKESNTEEPDVVNQSGISGVSDAEWLRSKTSRLLDLTDDVESHLAQRSGDRTAGLNATGSRGYGNERGEMDQNDGEDKAVEGPGRPPEEHLSNHKSDTEIAIETILENGRLFLRNLPYSSTEDDLRLHFAPFGELEEVHLPVDDKTRSSKGFAYILYKSPQDAVGAYQALDRKIFQGRLLHILAAAPKRENKLDEYAISKLPLKKQREIKRKVGAASSTFNWNSMYMSADAVMSSVADRLGVSKAELLDPTSSDAAVRQAHAETSIIQETKAYFKSNGIDLTAFERREKDDKVILFKNFPYGTKIEEIRNLAEGFGRVTRVLMPPAGTIAVVEFPDSPSARAAFASLAYSRFKDTVLFLEKAPVGLFIPGFVPDQSMALKSTPAIPTIGKPAKVSAQDLLQVSAPAAGGGSDGAAGVEIETATLFVRNLNFSTTSAGLAETFKPIDGFLSARVKTKTDPKKPGQTLSMGFGFIEFKTKKQALVALEAMDGYVLDGYKLLIKASHKGLDAAAERKRDDARIKEAGKRAKIIIKNLPFEATKKDVRSLFGQYGTLRSVRVPKKFGGSARGFGFAEFVTARDAESAMDSLKDTHLLGRRLVLEYAAEDATNAEEEIERMNQKISRQTNVVAMAKLKANSKRKVDLDESGNPMDDEE